MRLIPVDLGRAERDDHPDIHHGAYYLLKESSSQGVLIRGGKADRNHGLLQFHMGSYWHLWNAGNWLEILEVRDEPDSEEWFLDDRGRRMCNYCGLLWGGAHVCYQRNLVQAGIQLEQRVRQAILEPESAVRERRAGRARNRRRNEILQEKLTQAEETVRYLLDQLHHISEHNPPSSGPGGWHCGCFFQVRDMAREAILTISEGPRDSLAPSPYREV